MLLFLLLLLFTAQLRQFVCTVVRSGGAAREVETCFPEHSENDTFFLVAQLRHMSLSYMLPVGTIMHASIVAPSGTKTSAGSST
ncbi:unnamed protein product, partial [Polarella glacialis]